jgi:hypothetical protein
MRNRQYRGAPTRSQITAQGKGRGIETRKERRERGVYNSNILIDPNVENLPLGNGQETTREHASKVSNK